MVTEVISRPLPPGPTGRSHAIAQIAASTDARAGTGAWIEDAVAPGGNAILYGYVDADWAAGRAGSNAGYDTCRRWLGWRGDGRWSRAGHEAGPRCRGPGARRAPGSRARPGCPAHVLRAGPGSRAQHRRPLGARHDRRGRPGGTGAGTA